MTEEDLPSAVRLNTIAGWNQTEADWRRFLESSPVGCFVVEVAGQVAGTVATICYENRFAWIGMVLVDPDFRNRGIGTQLLHKAIEHLDRLGIATMKLDASHLGLQLLILVSTIFKWSASASRTVDFLGQIAVPSSTHSINLRLD